MGDGGVLGQSDNARCPSAKKPELSCVGEVRAWEVPEGEGGSGVVSEVGSVIDNPQPTPLLKCNAPILDGLCLVDDNF